MSFLAAVAFLTVLPLPARWRSDPRHLARSVRWYPLVGLGIGLALAGLDWQLGLVVAGPARDALLVAALLSVSGALHLDGLMDTCDGVLSTVPDERRLEIMRDSHVGSFGVAGAGLVLLGKYAALASLGDAPRWAALVALAVLGRWSMSLAVVAFPAGRPDGLGRLVKDASGRGDLAVAAAFALLACVVAFQAAGVLLFGVVSLTVWLVGRAILARLPGLTGDTYGALNEIGELAALVLAPLCVGLVAAGG
jgi:adenosylcobinamide-GDP ribazoletransferase